MSKKIPSAVVTTYRLLAPLFEPRNFMRGVAGYPRYVVDLMKYRSLSESNGKAFPIEVFPCLHDRTSTTSFEPHYCYMGYWALRRLSVDLEQLPHVDVGSQIAWVMSLAATRAVTFVDIRPFTTSLPNLRVQVGTILSLPFADRSVSSLSCLHVAEHIGLGRYGDLLDPQGTDRSILELARILAPGGRLLFALPVGRQRVCFNAHRVHDPRTILSNAERAGLSLVGFSCVRDDRTYQENVEPATLVDADYACGMFEFTRAIP